MADAGDSKSPILRSVRVRIPPPAPHHQTTSLISLGPIARENWALQPMWGFLKRRRLVGVDSLHRDLDLLESCALQSVRKAANPNQTE